MKQTGITLIELLITLAISGMVASLAIRYYMVTSSLNGKAIAQQLLASNASVAMSFLRDNVRDAGFADDAPWVSYSPIDIGDACINSNYCSTSYDDNTSDTLAIRYNPTNNMSCNGNTVSDEEVIVNHFYVDNASLRCHSYSVTNDTPIGTPVVLQNYIHAMQINYWIEDAANMTRVSEFDPATETPLAITLSLLVGSGLPYRSVDSNKDLVLLNEATFNESSFDERVQIVQSTFLINTTFKLKKSFDAMGL